MTRRRALSQRDKLRQNDAAEKFLSAMSGKPIPAGVLSNVPPAKPRIRKPSSPERVLERDVLRAIMAALKAHPKVASVIRRSVGSFVDGNGRWISYGVRGEPDLDITLHGGMRAMVEVKSPTGRVSVVQARRMEQARAIGVRCGVARNVEQAIAIIEGRA